MGAPIIGILGMTGDWQRRDTMTFFALVSRRWKIFVAKIAGTLIVSLAIVLGVVTLSLLLSALLVPAMGSAGQPETSAKPHGCCCGRRSLAPCPEPESLRRFCPPR
ncbi:hypothetical protein [Pseudarthrobacter albicanus]|uniref:hypothetical protein n=1 Tax=Pseudarthrobacter albicanus TaxID=2823873 RepID=UPI001FE51B7B|nr:hypothetical protein [Pseudarthrobacter albicanus]